MKRISTLIIISVFAMAVLAGCGESPDKGTEPFSRDGSSGFAGSGFVGSGAFEPTGSGYMDAKESHVPEVEAPKYKTIGNVSQGPNVKKTLLLNLTGKDIIGFAVKDSSETEFTNKLVLEGDIFVLDEVREVYYDPSPVKEQETETTTVTETQAQSASSNEKETSANTATEAETQMQPQTEKTEPAGDDTKQYDVQITFSDWTVYVIHDLPFDDMKIGRLLLQNDILFLEYTSEETGEEVITRQKEYNIKAAEWQAYQEQLAQQQAWQQQQQQQAWQQQQQQQQYVAPATSNDAGCVGDAGLMW